MGGPSCAQRAPIPATGFVQQLEGAAPSAPVEIGQRHSIQQAPTERRPRGIRITD